MSSLTSSRTVSKYRILVIDDLADNLFLLQTILETEGYEVDTVDRWNLALERLKTTPPDLILMDVMMPEMNGYELTRHIRQNAKLTSIPILLLTARSEASIKEGLASGANDFIRKPVDIEELLTRVQSFLVTPANVSAMVEAIRR